MSEGKCPFLRFNDGRYYNDLFEAEKFENENDIAPQYPELLMEKWHEFKEELLKKVRRVD